MGVFNATVVWRNDVETVVGFFEQVLETAQLAEFTVRNIENHERVIFRQEHTKMMEFEKPLLREKHSIDYIIIGNPDKVKDVTVRNNLQSND